MMLADGELRQWLIVGDLMEIGGDELIACLRRLKPDVIYTDPPWSQGGLRWWHNRVGIETPQYECFVARLIDIILAANPREIFIEQSANSLHRQALLDAAMSQDFPPLIETFVCRYGSKYSSVLLHFGRGCLAYDVSGLSGEKLVRTVFSGICTAFSCVADPCMGRGMTSRVAHRFNVDFIGLELDGSRLQVARNWLLKHGYSDCSIGA